MWLWTFGAIGAGVVAVIFIAQYRAAQGTHRPLSQRQPAQREQNVPLGMEAIDMESLSAANRRNESLERGQTNWLRKGGFFGAADTDVAPWADDETYAARFHAAFQNKNSKD